MNNAKIIEKDKRFVTMKRYQEISGLSYQTIDYLCKSGQLNYITTEGGLRKIDTKDFGADQGILLEKMNKTEKMLSALCKQFNIVV